ncbi:hypothetical protein [Candidatus Lokiarchaeum ossiferum]|uniref:hypothetical protein n=1 Tax=Candidatus Lokiarchaeum ossiferum TaxID=2951803 RepID=UPI00352DB3FC
MDAVTLLFPSHGIRSLPKAKKMMTHMNYHELLRAIHSEIKNARTIYKHVFIYEQSMEGLVPIRMASEELVDGCATTVPTIKFPFKDIFAAKFLG